MAVRPDPPSTTASTYDSDCVLDIGQVPRLGEEYDEVILYDELLSVHNALEALAECAGTDDCYCIELCDESSGDCKEYECDAFLTALNSTASNVWPMNDATGSTAIAASKGGVNVPQYGTPVYEKTSLLPDACVGSFSASDHGSEGWRDSTLAQVDRVPLTLEGSTGGLVDATTANVRITTLGFLNQTDVKLGLNHNGGSIEVILEGNGIGQLSLVWTSTPTTVTSFVLLNYTLAANGDYSIELFIDFVSYGTKAGNFTGNTFTINADTRYTLGGAGTGFLDNQFMYYNIDRLSTTEIAFLSDAWDQNQLGYVDPDPDCGASTFPIPENNQGLIYRSAGISEVTGLEEGCWEFACIPEVCCAVPGEGYLCDALVLALQGIAASVWVMDMASGSAIDSVSSNDLSAFSSPTYSQPSLLTDNCGELATAWNSTNGFRDETAAFIPNATGSLGLMVDTTDPNSLRVIQFGILNTSIFMSLNFAGSDTMEVFFSHYAEPNITLSYPGALDSGGPNYISINFSMSGAGVYEVELFKDFVSLGVQSGTATGSWAFGGADFRLGVTGGVGAVIGQYVYYSSSQLDSSQIEVLKEALAQNQATYQPPSTGVPTIGQVLKATGEEGDNTYCAEDIYPAGSVNQVLTRNSEAPDDVSWTDPGTAAGGAVIFSPYDPDPVPTGTFWVTGGY